MSTTVRRRVIRPPREAQPADPRTDRWRAELAKERQSCKRWFSRLKRAVSTLDKLQRRIVRLESSLTATRS